MQALVGLAIFLLAVNLAYVRFETFEHRRIIRDYAREKLGSADDVPSGWMDSAHFKRLAFWAGKRGDTKLALKDLGWWTSLCPYLFDAHRDKLVARIMIYAVLPVVVLGTGQISGQFTIPAQEVWISWLWLVLVIMTVGSVAIVLAGSHYVSKACEQIDQDADEWNIFMKNKYLGSKSEPLLPTGVQPMATQELSVSGQPPRA